MRSQPPQMINGIPTPLADIEAGLDSFWRHQAQSGQEVLLRTATMTLILVSEDEDTLHFFSHTVPELTGHHPGRIIIVRMNRSTDDGAINAHISAHCNWSPRSSRQLCCEQIILTCPASETVRLPGVLLPLLLVDLPVFVYWPDAIGQTTEWSTFFKYVDRLIIKSPEPLTDWAAMTRHASQVLLLNEQARVSDMTWAHVTPWRQAIAQLFDGADGAELAQNLTHIRFSTCGADLSGSIGWLLAWLMTAWKWQKASPTDLHFLHDGCSITVTVEHEDNRTDSLSDLRVVELTTARKGQPVRLWIHKQSSREIEYGETGQSRQTLTGIDCAEAHLLCRELDLFNNDDLFLQICRYLIFHENSATAIKEKQP